MTDGSEGARPAEREDERAGEAQAEQVAQPAEESAGFLHLVRLWFGLSLPVGRVEYLGSGVALAFLKYLAEALLVASVTGRPFMPWNYLDPLFSTRAALLRGHDGLQLALVAWTLPFLWVGLSMTLRRLRDAALPPALSLLFLVPGLNYILMFALCLAATRRRASDWQEVEPEGELHPDWRAALVGVASGVALSLAAILLSVHALGQYGATLFFGGPVLVGAVTAFLYNRTEPRSAWRTQGVVALAVLLGGLASLLFALEGAVCILMAAPIAFLLAAMGGLVGQFLASAARRAGESAKAARGLGLLVLAWPLVAAAEAAHDPARGRVFEVISTEEIDAPPEVVWRHVVGFSELPPPSELVLRLGVAYPLRATIEGSGAGAVRRCEFSTGAFVEPITTWDPPRRLAFDVVAQPPSMQEWSPYRHVDAPHLVGYMTSRGGEFRLVPLPGGRTRLEGSTWYTLDIHPQLYWGVWSDALLHTIHGRVLRHVKALSEADRT